MMTLGQYETLASAYNNTSTITYPFLHHYQLELPKLSMKMDFK
ncbi:hypothetical protein [Weissella confusa]|nr:hypothetical protein [Weissella confusa]